MKRSAELSAFEARLGHRFARPELLVRALTHPSFSSETRPSNQRLEFLGDRVLNLAIAEAMFAADATAAEGVLARRYNALVRKETCAEVAESIDLGAALRLGKTHMGQGGRKLQATLGDAMEAVLAAVYLDAGWEVARALVHRLWDRQITAAPPVDKDPKTALQERVQAEGRPPPDYVEVARTGPDHAPVFTIEARLADGRTARAEAGSKRAAEQAAAEALLTQMA